MSILETNYRDKAEIVWTCCGGGTVDIKLAGRRKRGRPQRGCSEGAYAEGLVNRGQ